MKAANAKKSTTTSTTVTQAANQPFFAKAGGGDFFAPVNRAAVPSVQMKMAVNKPGDKFEQEADKMAGKVMRMPTPASSEKLQRQKEDKVQKQEKEKIQKQEKDEIQKAELPEEQVQKQEKKDIQKAELSEDKVQKTALPEEKVQKKDDEDVQKTEFPKEQVQKQEKDEIQKAELPEEQVQKQEKQEIQKAELSEEKVQKTALPEEKVQKKGDEKIQKAELPKEQVQKQEDEKVQRTADEQEKIQRKGTGTPAVNAGTQSAIHSKTTGGQPLSHDVRGYMEPRFNADFSNVRVHNDTESAGLNNQLSARAFTYQNHIFFSRDQYQPGTGDGKQLLAHELTHTIQQGHSVQRTPQVNTTITQPAIQREEDSSWSLSKVGDAIKSGVKAVASALDLDKIKKFIEQNARSIPGFTLLTVILGKNPITQVAVSPSPAIILQGFVELLPGVGGLISQALEKYGVFSKVGAWLQQQLTTISHIGGNIWQGIKDFLFSTDIVKYLNDFSGAWARIKGIFGTPINQLTSFISGLVTDVVNFIKDAVIRPIGDYARENISGYPLLCAILGSDPVTGEKAAQDPAAFIGGFLTFVGQEETWQNLQKANAIDRAAAWFSTNLKILNVFVNAIPELFLAALKALQIEDLLEIPSAFLKIAAMFGSFAASFISWGATAVWTLLEIIFDAVAPGLVGYIKKAGGAFRTILKNPIGFAGNLVAAGKQGMMQFASNIGKHLKASLIKWITGSLSGAGVYIPQSFAIRELIKFVLSVLGLTWQNIRQKLVRVVGETAVAALESGFDIVKTLVTEGPAAAWEKIKEKLGNLKGMVMEGIISFVTNKIVNAAITKLVSMLNPVVGGIIQGAMGAYNTIMFFIERMSTMMQVAASFIDSIAAIASGQIAAAAGRVEQTLAGLLVLAISFLARQVGLGKVSEPVVNIIKKLQGKVDNALNFVVSWIVKIGKPIINGAKKLVGGKSKGKKKDKKKDKKGKLSPRKVKSLVFAAMGKPTRAKEPAAALAEKQAQAQSLLAQYQPKLKKGRLKINITDRSAKDVEKDAAVDFSVSASPGKRGEAKVPIDKDKEKKKVVNKVMTAMRRPTKAKTAEAALAEKQAQAQKLLSKYQPKIKKGQLKINITDRSVKDVEKDAAVDFAVSASPGKRGKAKVLIKKEKKNERTDVEKHRDLETASKAIKPQLDVLLARNPRNKTLTKKLNQWSKTYRLTSLRLDGTRIIARINPALSLSDVEHKKLGLALEPILQQAEKQYIDFSKKFSKEPELNDAEMVGPNYGPPSQDEIYGAWAAGSRPIPTAVAKDILTIRAVRKNAEADLASVPKGHVPMEVGGKIWYKNPQNVAQYYVPSPKGEASYEGMSSKPNGPVSSLPLHQQQILALEQARMPGMITAMQVAQGISDLDYPQIATTDEVAKGPLNPMRGRGTGRLAEQQGWSGRPVKRPSKRHGGIGRVFDALRLVLDRPENEVIGKPGGKDMLKLAKSFEAWFKANFQHVKTAQSQEEIDSLTSNLVDKLTQFLNKKLHR